jgi:hypothetical protein
MLKKTDNLCLECHEAIFNPICPRCLSEEVRQWAINKNQKVKDLIEEEIKTILRFGLNKKGCLKCGSDVFLCPYCFTERVYLRLKNAKFSKKILKEFLEFFNFDFEHTGYTKDMEKLGLI